MKLNNRTITLIKTLWSGQSGPLTQLDERIIDTYIEGFNLCVDKEGKKGALIRYKAYHQVAVKMALFLPGDPIPFTKSDKDGVPRVLKPLVPRLKGSSEERREALTLTNLYRLIHLKPSTDTKTITDPGVLISEEFMNEGNSFIKSGLTRLPSPYIESDPVGHNSGGKSGPNGPALISSHYDAVAVIKEGLLPYIEKIGELSSHSDLNYIEWLSNLTPDDNYKTSKLSFLPEGGGKTRVIAIGDYYTQQVLKPLHRAIMKILGKLETDGTFNQDDQTNRLRERAGHEAESIDLSSATDRFPLKLQKSLLHVWFGDDVANAGESLMVGREFHTPTSTVRYSVGQPMGFYSSWAVFALTHHAFVEFAAHRKGFNSFRDYSLLGDDIVIGNREVAIEYKRLLKELGIPYSKEKSLSSDNNHVRVEFAKRFFLNGTEITPLNPNIIKAASKSIYDLLLLTMVMSRRGGRGKETDIQAPEFLSRKGKELLVLLGHLLRVVGCPPFKGVTPSLPERELIENKFNQLRLERLQKKLVDYQKIIENPRALEDLLQSRGVLLSEELVKTFHELDTPYPLVWVLGDIEQSLAELQGNLLFPEEGKELSEILADVEYLPKPGLQTFYPAREGEFRLRSSTGLTAYLSLKKDLEEVRSSS